MRVVITDRNLLPLRDELEALVPRDELVWLPGDLLDALKTAEVLVGPAFTQEMADAAPDLRLVQVAGAGTDRVQATGVPVANTYHHEDSIAEYIVWALIALRRELPQADAALRQNRWRSPVYDAALPQPQTLSSAKVGFLGFGHIGRAAWRVLQAFGAQAQAITASGKAPAGNLNWAGDTTQLPRLLEDSNALVVSAPLTEATRGIIGAGELSKLGADGVLVNVARGPLVQEQALYDALRSHTIRGAALDVWYSYPADGDQARPAEAPFGDLDNVLLTPHLSGITQQTFRGRIHDIAANLTALAEGNELRNLVRL
ncbi:phosphoglycerate dehydrogenase-like enzyme [Kribbella sp. VKM Ac-2571]|uniref:2-hydroxyacid dehydrogenase n=1 Tax=Kribbella sp. VKM Ac-2571 TaxID=2512222 RepID=UPI001060043F|nr:2-hydroxyacid dehydrogenase [Kribbella sp. VKM Ac-2571]TDO52972.1 phosphoglycerate dehydrogenase-like enzyme [Kribbella sp. VKM Ac-2571]